MATSTPSHEQRSDAVLTSGVGAASASNRFASFALDPLLSRWRAPVVVGTVVASVAHVPVIGPHLAEAPYMGVLFIVLTAACAVLALAVLVRDSRAVYALVVLTCGLAVIGYAATRLVAFPMLSDDVGNWLEPLGVVSIISESVAVVAAIAPLVARRHGAGHGGNASAVFSQSGTAS